MEGACSTRGKNFYSHVCTIMDKTTCLQFFERQKTIKDFRQEVSYPVVFKRPESKQKRVKFKTYCISAQHHDIAAFKWK